ncbi:hypothetical protein E2C01_082878 [Portunus trituberculatus]|uniref:Uncharacterized protein n=1 Tax=Portunus trituberculatus TaxID=210409 RepID=A0A5B7ITG4_PORTR|nr:hypothetical protein [Portunus trituberculatus]
MVTNGRAYPGVDVSPHTRPYTSLTQDTTTITTSGPRGSRNHIHAHMSPHISLPWPSRAHTLTTRPPEHPTHHLTSPQPLTSPVMP